MSWLQKKRYPAGDYDISRNIHYTLRVNRALEEVDDPDERARELLAREAIDRKNSNSDMGDAQNYRNK